MIKRQNKLKKIEMYGEEIFVDCRYSFVCELISEDYQEQAELLDDIFDRAPKELLFNYIDRLLQDEDIFDDVAMIFFLGMLLQNHGELIKASNIITRMYKRKSSDLLAKCAFAHQLFFYGKIDEVPAIFNNDFNFTQVTIQRTFPLPTIVHCLSIACDYYLIKKDVASFNKVLSYLFEVAPEHDATQRLLVLSNKK